MATEKSKAAAEKSEAEVEKNGGTIPAEDGVGTAALTGGVTAAETQGDDTGKDLTDKDSGSAVSSGPKTKPGKPGKDYDVESDPVIPSSVARDEVRRELELFGESPTLAGLVENYKGDRDL